MDEVFLWMMTGDVTVESDNPDIEMKVDEASAAEIEGWFNIRALVIGRRTFDLAGGWSGTHPVGAPVWIPTHNPPDGWDDAPFTFVTDGVEAAVKQASEHADDGIVGVAGSSVVRQCLNAGVLDAGRVASSTRSSASSRGHPRSSSARRPEVRTARREHPDDHGQGRVPERRSAPRQPPARQTGGDWVQRKDQP